MFSFDIQGRGGGGGGGGGFFFGGGGGGGGKEEGMYVYCLGMTTMYTTI